jgi:hypothetical protein
VVIYSKTRKIIKRGEIMSLKEKAKKNVKFGTNQTLYKNQKLQSILCGLGLRMVAKNDERWEVERSE